MFLLSLSLFFGLTCLLFFFVFFSLCVNLCVRVCVFSVIDVVGLVFLRVFSIFLVFLECESRKYLVVVAFSFSHFHFFLLHVLL